MSVRNIRSAAKFKQTVLLIDDQPMVLDIHAAILSSLRLNLKLVSMTDPQQALDWMKNKQVDLIVTDFRMMKMDGMAFVQAIKLDNSMLQRTIIVVTAMKDRKLHQELIDAGASACFTKPVDAKAFADTAKKVLEQSKERYRENLIN